LYRSTQEGRNRLSVFEKAIRKVEIRLKKTNNKTKKPQLGVNEKVL